VVIFITLNLPWNDNKLQQYDGKLTEYFNPRKSRVKITMVIYLHIFITVVPGFKPVILYPGANVIKLFTVVTYYHSMVLLSSCVVKHYYCSKYHRMAVKILIKSFITLVQGGKH
jgi:hypothetical protein